MKHGILISFIAPVFVLSAFPAADGAFGNGGEFPLSLSVPIMAASIIVSAIIMRKGIVLTDK